MCPPPDGPSSHVTCVSGAPPLDEFSPEERGLLLRLAHQAISATLERRKYRWYRPLRTWPSPAAPSPLFTYRGDLRGCVGYVFPVTSLYRTVAESARGAAFDDSRFPPVTRNQALEVRVSLSVLSPLHPLRPEQVEVGRHGLLISLGPLSRPVAAAGARSSTDGTASPFSNKPARKAGLPPDSWQTGAKLEAFTAEIFADPQ